MRQLFGYSTLVSMYFVGSNYTRAFGVSSGRIRSVSRRSPAECIFAPSKNRGYVQTVVKVSSRDSSLYENVISSSKSATVKKIQAVLSHRKKRIGYGQTLVEGPRMVFDLLENPATASLVQHILISVENYQQYRDRLDKLSYSEINPHIQLVESNILKACTDTVTPQGIVALVDIPKILPDLANKYPFFLVLDGVSDPGNVGTLLRSSLAVGVAGVLILPGCCDVWNPKAVRSSMGASFQLPIVDVSGWDDAIQKLVGENNVRQIYGATMMEEDQDNQEGDVGGSGSGSGSQSHFDVDWLVQPSALVIGSEGSGLSADIRAAVEGRRGATTGGAIISAVHVPMKAGIESLNAAVCGSVIMFEYSRQREQLVRNA
jgi:RNA methyltransferase, TrmH family